MIQKIQQLLIAFALVLGLGAMAVAPAGAINVFDEACKGSNSKTTICDNKGEEPDGLVKSIVRILLWAVGTISVIMIIVGSIRFALSAGDSSQVNSARDTVIYAVVGLVVAMLAYAIVKFVVGWF